MLLTTDSKRDPTFEIERTFAPQVRQVVIVMSTLPDILQYKRFKSDRISSLKSKLFYEEDRTQTYC